MAGPTDGDAVDPISTGRTARLVDEDGVLVATGETEIDDHDVFGLLDGDRRRWISRRWMDR